VHWVPHVVPGATPEHAERVPRGTPETAVHVPTEPVTLHAPHVSVHATLQHTPSLQLPDEHS
jgi:hypothetical protein